MKKPKNEVHAGEIYRARAPRVRGGYRYVKVKQVRQMSSNDPYVLLQEVDQHGRAKTGYDKYGFSRSEPFTSVLTRDSGREPWRMSGGYEHLPDNEK